MSTPHRALTVAAPVPATPLTIAWATSIPKPSLQLVSNGAGGKKLFAGRQVQCHAADLRGTKEGPTLVHRIYERVRDGDIEFQMAVWFGARQRHCTFGDIKPVPGLSPDEVAHITAYVRAEQPKARIR